MFFSYIKLIFIINMNELIENSQLLSFPLFCVFIYFFILFFQSSVDKILNWSSELEWIKSHFGKSIFKSNVPYYFLLNSIRVSYSNSLFVINI